MGDGVRAAGPSRSLAIKARYRRCHPFGGWQLDAVR